MQLVGTRIKSMLFSHSISQHACVTCPLIYCLVFSFLKFPTLLSDQRNDDFCNVIDHCCFITPVVVRMSNMSVVRKLGIGMALSRPTLVYKLHREKFTCKRTSKHGSNLPLVIKAFYLDMLCSLFFHCPIGHRDVI